ncbi:MAG: transcriptional regulator [Bryobacteraceae bacterium]|jgi:HTH-type transcriptional regulator/antitoxin HigA
MGLTALNPAKYGRLCATVVPKVIESDEEFDRLIEQMEALDRKQNPTPEEEALSALLLKLIQDYDDLHYPLPDVPPHKMIAFLMDQKHLRQADLLPVFGSRSVASEVLAGKREPSKAHIRKLAEFFHVSAELFL